MTEIDKKVSLAHVRELAATYSNWGKWGPDDELGTLNYVTPETIRSASTLVRTGKVFPLAIPLDDEGPMRGMIGRHNPSHTMIRDGGDVAKADAKGALDWTDDAISMLTHSSTHWDALSHIFFEGKMYNDRGTDDSDSYGSHRNAITVATDKMVGRGVLLDIPKLTDRPWLDAGEAVELEDLEAACELHGVEVGEGDFVIVRTGRIEAGRAAGDFGNEFAGDANAGLGVSAAKFLCERRVAGVAADNMAVDVLPYQSMDDGLAAPLHVILIVMAGMYLGEMWDLEALAADCAADGVYEFMLVAAPLNITRGVGSPINPQAIK